MEPNYQVSIPGKWILAGEHSVLRGSGALVFPLMAKQIELNFFAGEHSLSWDFAGEFGHELEYLFRGVFSKACEIKKINSGILTGKLFIKSNIPVGAGMGASAALCVALTMWLNSQGHVEKHEAYDFARGLEDLFHGESSGVDIAVALSRSPLYFERSGIRQTLKLAWLPQFYLSYSGKRGATQECVHQVKKLFQTSPLIAAQCDRTMREVTLDCLNNLVKVPDETSFKNLCLSINKAHRCFEDWGLCEGPPARHIEELRQLGASAAKLTGSGSGGYVLSLWKNEPPLEVIKLAQLIKAI